jgi:TolB protein
MTAPTIRSLSFVKFMAAALIALCGLFAAGSARAELRVDVTRGVVEPMPIAISPFHVAAGGDQEIAAGIPQIVTSNLERSGLFAPMNPASFIQDPASIDQSGPRFPEWRAINAQALVTGTATRTADGKTRVEFRLWDVFSQQQMIGMAYMTTPQNWRRIAHIISDEIYKRITGESGYFDSRIVFISEEGPPAARVKRLAIMDQDGANARFLTDGRNLVLTPRFSPNEQQITYLSYHNNRPRVYLYNIDTGRQEVLGDFPGMTFAPRFSPDGNRVIMSMAQNGNSDIYAMDLRSRQVRQLTNSVGIDTAPCYAPDGRQVAFESDRGGTQQIYVMNADGSNPQRITFGEGRYGNPVWSPRGDLIAFTKMLKGQFYIGVIRPDGSGERLITRAYHVEGPSWSPNGRVLVYFKERPTAGGNQRSARLYTIDLTGYNEQELKTPRDGSDPAWSPINP